MTTTQTKYWRCPRCNQRDHPEVHQCRGWRRAPDWEIPEDYADWFDPEEDDA